LSETEPTDAAHLRLPRRRRSATHTPALLEPAELPEDAAGRVDVIAVRAPADVLDTVETPAQPPPAEGPALRVLLMRDGWIAIGVLAAVLAIVFVIGMVFTH